MDLPATAALLQLSSGSGGATPWLHLEATRGRRKPLLAILVCIWGPVSEQPKGACAQECYCRYAPDAPTSNEPLWTCSGGVRQYHCLAKTRLGRWNVARGQVADRLAPIEFCSPARAADACDPPWPSVGFTLHGGDWRANAELMLEVTCPPSVDCVNAMGMLSTLPCAEGPANGPIAEEWRFITDTPRTEIPSPTHSELVYAGPFGHRVYIEHGTIAVASLYYEKIWMFGRQPDGLWGTVPTTSLVFPTLASFPLLIDLMNFSSEAIIVGTYKEALAPGDPGRDEFEALPGQQVFVFPRLTNGEWESENPVVWGSQLYAEDTGGFGIAVGISGVYAIVGSTLAQRAFIYERSTSGVWGTSAAKVIDKGFVENIVSFGEAVAISGGGVAFVGAPSNRELFVFQRESAWGFVDHIAYPSVPGFPGPMAVSNSGDYLIIGAPEADKAFIFERAPSTGVWSLALEAFGHTNAGSLFGGTVDISDQGGGNVAAVVGAKNARRALLFLRNPATGDWEAPFDLGVGAAINPFGFGRSVGVSGDTIVVGSDAKKVYLFTQQPIGRQDRTGAVGLSGPGPRHGLTLDARHLVIGVDYTLCLDLDGEGTAEHFTDVGLRIRVAQGDRSQYKEEL